MSVANALLNITRELNVSFHRPSGFSPRVAATYLRLQLRDILARRKSSHPGEDERIAGALISSPNPGSLFSLFKEIFVGEEYHFQATSHAPVIIDAGANIGMASLYFRKLYPQAKILAFEPDPAIFTVLQANVERNRLGIQCVNAAVDESTGTKDFFTGAECSASGSLHPHESLKGATTVQCVRMSAYVGRWVDLLKLDVEGSETAVLCELAASGKLESIGQVIVEFHPHKGQPRNDLQTCMHTLRGFEQCTVDRSAGAVLIRASRRGASRLANSELNAS